MTIKKRTWIPSLAVAALTTLLAVTASAQPMRRVAEELGLTDEQRQSLADMRTEFAGKRQDGREQREQLAALTNSGDVDAAAELAANQARERVYQKAEMHQRVAEILTPDQLQQWDALREERGHGRKGKRSGESRREGRGRQNGG